jgi:hypothetical protein
MADEMRRAKWAVRVAYLKEKRSSYRDWIRKCEVGRPLGRPRCRWKIQNLCRGNSVGGRGVDYVAENRK